AALVRWKARQGDVIQDCYGWVRGAMGVETCGPPGRPGGALYSSETPSDIDPELRQHALFFEVPPDIASVTVITKDGFRVRAPVFDRLALAEWRGHGEWACVVGLHRNGSQVVINGHCP
ncbi:MAG TPA: hypothetical protein VJR05_14190, partial [Acidimicrobiia bacterium]|nr:hypothetical protein [Acidimicrobiia bacterium]